MAGALSRVRQERKRCLQCHGSTLFLITEEKNEETGEWEEKFTRRNCGHREQDDPSQDRPMMRKGNFDAFGNVIPGS